MEELELNRESVYNTIKEIVQQNHSHPHKKEVRLKDGGGFQIACPYCGDSQKRPRNYRGNFNSLLFYKCFNDGCGKQTHFTQFCKDFGVNLDIDTKQKLYKFLDAQSNSLDNYQDELINNGIKNLIDLDDLIEKINSNQTDSPLKRLQPIVEGSVQHDYILSRGIPPEKTKYIYQAVFQRTPDWVEPVIVYLNAYKNKIIGMQSRNLHADYRRKFHIFTYKDLYSWLGGEELSDGQLIMYNKISYLYGILSVDFSKKVTLFEGYSDSLLYPNSIGVIGVNTDISLLTENNIDLQFLYDNDVAGFRKSEEMINKGFSVFLWKKFFNYLLEKKSPNKPYEYLRKIKKVKDLSKLNQLSNGILEKINFQLFFSKDKLDKKYIPKTFKKYNKRK